MKVIVITGGIASGKSTAVEMLRSLGGDGVAVFDCDRAVAEMEEQGLVSGELVSLFGNDVLDREGRINKDFLREIVRKDPEGRARMESVFHPRLAQMCRAALDEARSGDSVHTFVADVPLYFESKEKFPADIVCVVATTEASQMSRMAERDGFSPDVAQEMAAAQMPTEQKMSLADVVFWNDGCRETLEAQIRLFYEARLAGEARAMRARKTVIDVNALRNKELNELQQMATALPRRGVVGLARAELVSALMRYHLSEGATVVVSGILEFLPRERSAVLRDPARSFRCGADDIYVGQDMISRYDLRPGNALKVKVGFPRGGKADRYLAATEALEIEGVSADDFVQKKDFDRLTPLIPSDRLILENMDIKSSSMRVLDLITPLGMGQRALIVAPPRGGKTVLLKMMAKSLRMNYPNLDLLVLLLDERPEEVSDFEETVDAPVFASTFDEPSRRHAQLSDMVLERARRMVEQGRDVVILLDSLTRLSRGYNANLAGGRTMSGGLSSNALEKPRKFFGAARKVEEGGSLTIIATCLVDTESRMDEIIFEEFKGTGNMEIRLDRELAERRMYPAISVSQSGTRNDDRLYHPDEFVRILQLRRQLAALPGWEGLEALLKNISSTQNNAELLIRGLVVK